MIDIDKLEVILPTVLKPARYTGGELGEIKKILDRGHAAAGALFSRTFMRSGMSHLGLGILYHLANGMENVYAERCFSPWPDMEDALKEGGYAAFFT